MRIRNRRGFVMVQALIVIAGLVALLALLAAGQRVSLNATQTQLRTRRANIGARSALAVAMATLQNANPNIVTLTDEWATLGDDGNQSFELDSTTTYRVQILDASSRVNVNTVTELQLQSFPLTPEQRDSLLDWREATLAARPQGAKDQYYNTLPQPYNAKLGRITTINELLLIRDWTAPDLYGPPNSGNIVTTAPPPQDDEGNELPLADVLTAESGMPNTRADGTARVNISQGNLNPGALVGFGIDPQTAQAIADAAPFASWAELLVLPGVANSPVYAQRLLEDVTVVPLNRLEGKLNLNTATAWSLETVLGIPQDIVSGIVTRQQSGGFQSLGDLATVPGLSGLTLAQVVDNVGVGSDTWIVRAYGESGGVGVAFEATVGLRNGRVQIVTLEKLADTGVPARWNWTTEPTATVDGPSELGDNP